MIQFGRKVCHSCESRNPFRADAAVPGAVDSCFHRNDKKNLIIEAQVLKPRIIQITRVHGDFLPV
ncbi:Uncharacterized protein dnm_066790 [Desulfonema magnum]|uniref:Uncharacterized protein n=1 Tax=Desulfonema magnum TaxID=45655 RepID=A0A975BSJ0_9BACT|nr:Uncharacterized protein dnm_066790 [Desulfonema magnum]